MYQIPELVRFPGLIHGFSTIKDGDMSFNFLPKEKVIENRKRFIKKLNIKLDDCVSLLQVHSDKVLEVGKDHVGRGAYDWKNSPKGDAMITVKKGIALILKTADCAPIIIYDPVVGTLGLVHAGWKGADNKIVVKTIKRLQSKYKSKSENMIVAIGPAARRDSFIKENPSQKDDPKWQPFMEHAEGEIYKVDFVGLIKEQLGDCGVVKENIIDSEIDTVADIRFFSHYRDSRSQDTKKERFATVVCLI